jgi:hypothetical protein
MPSTPYQFGWLATSEWTNVKYLGKILFKDGKASEDATRAMSDSTRREVIKVAEDTLTNISERLHKNKDEMMKTIISVVSNEFHKFDREYINKFITSVSDLSFHMKVIETLQAAGDEATAVKAVLEKAVKAEDKIISARTVCQRTYTMVTNILGEECATQASRETSTLVKATTSRQDVVSMRNALQLLGMVAKPSDETAILHNDRWKHADQQKMLDWLSDSCNIHHMDSPSMGTMKSYRVFQKQQHIRAISLYNHNFHEQADIMIKPSNEEDGSHKKDQDNNFGIKRATIRTIDQFNRQLTLMMTCYIAMGWLSYTQACNYTRLIREELIDLERPETGKDEYMIQEIRIRNELLKQVHQARNDLGMTPEAGEGVDGAELWVNKNKLAFQKVFSQASIKDAMVSMRRSTSKFVNIYANVNTKEVISDKRPEKKRPQGKGTNPGGKGSQGLKNDDDDKLSKNQLRKRRKAEAAKGGDNAKKAEAAKRLRDKDEAAGDERPAKEIKGSKGKGKKGEKIPGGSGYCCAAHWNHVQDPAKCPPCTLGAKKCFYPHDVKKPHSPHAISLGKYNPAKSSE